MSPSPVNSYNVLHYGMGDLTGGLCQITQINAYGLMTKGFLWQAGEIWFYKEDVDDISQNPTGWTLIAENQSLGYATGTVYLYRNSRSYGVFNVTGASTFFSNSTGITFVGTSNPTFTNSNTVTFYIFGATLSHVPVAGDVYADNNGTQFTIVADNGWNIVTTTSSNTAPDGLQHIYETNSGGDLTLVSGTGTPTFGYTYCDGTAFKRSMAVRAVDPGVESNISSTGMITGMSSLADTNVAIYESSEMDGGTGIYTVWTESVNYGMYEYPG